MAWNDKNKIITSFYKYPLSHAGPFVYYKSLLEKSAYGAQLNYNAANKFLFGYSNFINKNNKRGQERIAQAMAILQNSAQAEAEKENAFLQSLERKINKIGIQSDLPDITTEPFEFMAILNEYITGAEQYKAELNQEITRIRDYQGKIKQYKNTEGIHQAISNGEMDASILHNLSNTMEGLTSKKGIKSSSFTAYNAAVRTGTVMSKIAEGVIYRLVSKYADSLIDIEKLTLKLDGKQANALVTAIANEIQRRYRAFGGRNSLTMEKAEELLKNIKDDDQLYDDIFKKYASMSAMVLESLSSFSDSYTNDTKYKELVKQPRKNRQSRDNLRKRMEEGFKGFKERQKKSAQQNKQYEKLLRQLSNELSSAALSIAKPKVYFQSEANLGQLINENISVLYTGKTTKDDVGAILIDLEDVGMDKKNANELQKNITNIYNKHLQMNHYKEGTAEEFWDNAQNAINALQEVEKELLETADKLDIDIKELKELTDIFMIHGNVKSYDTINVGRTKAFGGGSIGANITEQLTNIATLLNVANYGSAFTAYDQKWLLSAIINSGSGLVGEENREGLEKYLSAMLGYLLFDDAYLIINSGANHLVQSISGTTVEKIHIYNLNGTYVPCSFVLQSTYDNLRNHYYQQLVGLGENSYGIQAKITARGAVGGPFKSPKDWETERQAAMKAAKIEVNFMANFLGLLDNIGQALSPG